MILHKPRKFVVVKRSTDLHAVWKTNTCKRVRYYFLICLYQGREYYDHLTAWHKEVQSSFLRAIDRDCVEKESDG